jgi:anti-anti-sigma factor
MKYMELKKGHFHVLVVQDKVDFFNISEFKKILIDDIIVNNDHVALHIAGNMDEISSSVINALIIACKKLNARKGSFVLVNVGESVRNLLTLAGLSGFFTIVGSVDDLLS